MSVKKQENFVQPYADRPHILVVDDDARIRELVVRYLTQHDFVAMWACDASQAKDVLNDFDVDVMIIDVMMPGKSGVEFMHDLRESGNTLPAIMLTALGEVDDRITGLEAGVDDYLTKPFEPRELVLRLNAILKRSKSDSAQQLSKFRIGPWIFDEGIASITHKETGEEVALTTLDVKLIKALAAHAGKAVDHIVLAKECGVEAAERNIDVQVTRLRRKIEEDTKTPRYLQTVRGQGYLLRVEPI